VIKIFEKIGRPIFLILYLFITLLVLITKLVFSVLQSTKEYFNKYLILGFSVLIVITVSAYIFFLSIIYNLPSPDTLAERQIDASTKIYDRNDVLLYTIYKDKNRSLVSFEEIPQHVKLATLAAEDASFYSHQGFSIKGIARATWKYFSTGKITGGSTITQQLVKNALLTPEKTLARKLREAILALGVEHKYSKDEILTMYLNEIPYGGTTYGVKQAAKVYFNKNLEQLTISEAALIAGLTKSPTLHSPFGNSPDLAKTRQEDILNLMHKNGFITQEQLSRELNRELKLAEKRTDIKAPHFVMYVKNRLVDMFGEKSVQTLGLKVHTTLDYNFQNILETAISEEIDSLRNLNVTNGAGIILDVKTGEILAFVGSRDYFSPDGNVNVLTRLRQPGSSIKPINYAYALGNGFTPATIINDSPVRYKIAGQADYIPKNYDGKFRGKITLRSALAESRNIPAVKVLNKNGVENMITLGQQMGITTWNDPYRFGLSLTLGGGDIKLIELAQAYQIFANAGQKSDLKSINKVIDINKKAAYKSCLTNMSCTSKQIISPQVAFQLTDILSDNKARTPAFGANSTLVIKGHPEVAVKTGTSNNIRDNLTLGYNQDYLVAIWVGNNDNSPMSRVASGVTGASAIWNKTMTALLLNKESVAWNVPENLSKKTACGPTGKIEDWFIEGTYSNNCSTKTAKKSVEHSLKN